MYKWTLGTILPTWQHVSGAWLYSISSGPSWGPHVRVGFFYVIEGGTLAITSFKSITLLCETDIILQDTPHSICIMLWQIVQCQLYFLTNHAWGN